MPKFTREGVNPAFFQRDAAQKSCIKKSIGPAQRQLWAIIKESRKQLRPQGLPLKVSEKVENALLQMNAILR